MPLENMVAGERLKEVEDYLDGFKDFMLPLIEKHQEAIRIVSKF